MTSAASLSGPDFIKPLTSKLNFADEYDICARIARLHISDDSRENFIARASVLARSFDVQIATCSFEHSVIDVAAINLSARPGGIIFWGNNPERIYLDGSYLYLFKHCESLHAKTLPLELNNIYECIYMIRLLFGSSTVVPISVDILLKKHNTSINYTINSIQTVRTLGDSSHAVEQCLPIPEQEFILENVNAYTGAGKSLGLRLIERAQENQSIDLKFILLWTALEVMAGDSGKKRKQFFLRELKSQKINECVRKLFIKRVDLLHFGKADGEFQREVQHRRRIRYPSVVKQKTVLPCQDMLISQPMKGIGSLAFCPRACRFG